MVTVIGSGKSRRTEELNVTKHVILTSTISSLCDGNLRDALATDFLVAFLLLPAVGRYLLSLSHLHIFLYCVITTRFLSSVGTRVFANGLPMYAYSFASVVLTGNTKSRLSPDQSDEWPELPVVVPAGNLLGI